jgi:hypothetical protein
VRGSHGVFWFRLSHQVVVCGEVDLGEMVEPHGPPARGLLVLAALPVPRFLSRPLSHCPGQIDGIDPAARGGLWLDYAEHATVLAQAGVLAASHGPGWRIV